MASDLLNRGVAASREAEACEEHREEEKKFPEGGQALLNAAYGCDACCEAVVRAVADVLLARPPAADDEIVTTRVGDVLTARRRGLDEGGTP